ncbi:HNH endonuclease [Chitinophagaceae bacterium 26-R-25]|nr:HNH endonuclease [Chitinophagaceae bacterium 26-R-25]
MIKINKGTEPAILQTNKQAWTTELLGYIQKGDKVPDGVYNRYNHEEIKIQLKTECNNKCMYCESPIAHVSYEHIEHIQPKAKTKFPNLTYEWANLGLACPVCNMNKGDHFDATLPLINPYVDNPEDFLIALANWIYHKPAKQRGELTTKILKLNRPELLERRLERLDLIRLLIDKYHNEKNLVLKKAIKDEIEIETQKDKPYSLFSRSLYKAMTS